jgi:hypothetical protein
MTEDRRQKFEVGMRKSELKSQCRGQKTENGGRRDLISEVGIPPPANT